MISLPPRLVVAGTHSGVGKTTVATGLMAALRGRGLTVSAAKVGPDYIDPSYHRLATGRPSRNLDAWISGLDAIAPLAGRAGAGVDVLIVEGVMGLFDGAADGDPCSTADVAVALDAPVLLVVDASAMSGSVAALVHGFATYNTRVRVAGVVLNRVGSITHRDLLIDALEPLGVPVVGALMRDDSLTWRDRHLGLVPVVEAPSQISRSLERVAAIIDRSCDLDQVIAIARHACHLTTDALTEPRPAGAARVAVAEGAAFSFAYRDNIEALTAAGAEIVPFDPLNDPRLPADVDALMVGGGFPEVYGEQLADNRGLLVDVADRVGRGLTVWAECGGLLWLAQSLDGRPMAGVLPTDAAMGDRLHLGYRRAIITTASPLGAAGTEVRGHEFHYSTCEPMGDAIEFASPAGNRRGGFTTDRLIASYLHLHLATRPDLAEHFIATAARRH